MKEVAILVEGQTEEKFVKEVLQPITPIEEIYFKPIIITSKRSRAGEKNRGGLTSYDKAKRDLLNILEAKNYHIVSTMVDYYQLPENFPGYSELGKYGTALERVEFLEKKFGEDIADRRFIPYLQFHEFESLLYSNPNASLEILSNNKIKNMMTRALSDFSNDPELVNNSVETAPSKRILKVYPKYEKVFHGIKIAKAVGLDVMRERCKHFDQWVEKLIA